MGLQTLASGTTHQDGSNLKLEVADISNRMLLESILTQLIKMNLHLSIMSELEVDDEDVGDNGLGS